MLCVTYLAKDLMYPGRECSSDLPIMEACDLAEADRVVLRT